jgi:hypothetical protein
MSWATRTKKLRYPRPATSRQMRIVGRELQEFPEK